MLLTLVLLILTLVTNSNQYSDSIRHFNFNLDQYIQSENFYILKNNSTKLDYMDFLNNSREVAVLDYFAQVAEIPVSKSGFRKCTIQVLREIQIEEFYRLNWQGTIWNFQSEAFVPKNLAPRLSDHVYIRDNKTGEWRLVYQTKQKNYRQVIPGQNSELWQKRNLQGVTLKVTHVILGNESSLKFSSSGRDTLGHPVSEADDRISYYYLAFMQDYLNFSVLFYKTGSWVWAPDNTTLSMADLLTQQHIDLAISNTGMWNTSNYRFLFVTRIFRELYVYYHPPRTSNSKDLTKAIGIQIWFVFIGYGCVIFSCAMIIFINKPAYLFIWSISTITEKTVPPPRTKFTHTAKCFMLTCSLSGLLLYISVSSFLVSSFTVEDEVNELEDLISRKYKFGLWENSIVHNKFKFNWVLTTSALWGIRSIFRTFENEPVGAAEVVNRREFAFISEQEWFLKYPNEMTNLPLCGNMKEFILQEEKRWGSAFIKPNSEFSDLFNLARIAMFQSGLTDRILKGTKRRSEIAKPQCIAHGTQQIPRAISLGEIRLLFLIWEFGIAISFVLLMIEIGRRYKRSRILDFITGQRWRRTSVVVIKVTFNVSTTGKKS